ncbi:MAG: ParB/RepB/Spo0J family partition protein [Actinomycetaceae bacterium]|nr:ParB/RepB/Spo0J family partition protein [Actinomycetaceae bacterium]
MARKSGLGQGLSSLIPQEQREPTVEGRGVSILIGEGTQAAKKGRQESGVHGLLSPGGQKKTSRGRGARPVEDKRTAGQDVGAGPELVPVPGVTVAELKLDDIIPNTRQPRTVFDADELEELARSIREVGVLQPVVVRPLDAKMAKETGAHFELIMGERRWRASKIAGNDTVSAIVRRTDDEDLLRDALLENLHRAQLNPLEEAAAYQQLMEDFGCTQEELAKRIARSRPQISNTIRLLRLPGSVQSKVAAGVLSAGHARALLGLSGNDAMELMAQRIIAEGLSVRSTEEIISMGDEEPVAREKSASISIQEPRITDPIARKLGDLLDTKVDITLGKRRSRIVIHFADLDDLNRIVEVLDTPAT